MNTILNHILEQRHGHYCHVIEVASAYEIGCIIESLISELKDQFTKEDFIGFFTTMQVIAYIDPDENEGLELTSEQEDEIYNFSIIDHINYIFD